MIRFVRHMVGVAAFAALISSTATSWAVSPKPLENAYWRFEEGADGSQVPGGTADTVLDSANQNHLKTDNESTAPLYTTGIAPTPLKSGLPSNLALNFQGDDHLFAVNAPDNEGGKNIDNGMIGGPNGGNVTGITIEAAFQPSVVDAAYHAIIGKDGAPVANNPLQTFVLKIRGDNQKLQVEQFDGGGTSRQISSDNIINAGQWYYASVVNDGSTLSLYLDSNDGNGYQLQDSVSLNGGAMWQGANHASYSQAWTVGRGQFNGGSTDFFNGIIDDVRITNRALQPWEFLYSPNQGDFNGDNVVDAADYVIWRKTNVDGEQGYLTWRANYGRVYALGQSLTTASVPEPAAIARLASAMFGLACSRRRFVKKSQ